MATFGVGEAILLAGAVAAAAGTAVTVYSAVEASKASSDLAKANQQSADNEATSKQQAAAYSEQQFRRRAAILIGRQEADMAAAGTDLTSGSSLFQELDLAKQSELEALNIRRSGDAGAASSRFEGQIARMRGQYARGQIAPAVAGGVFSAGNSILSSWGKYDSSRPAKGAWGGYL